MRILLPVIWLLSAIFMNMTLAQFQRPTRPERFQSPQQITNYLKDLRDYYSVHGRGRYGKRGMESPYFIQEFDYETPLRSLIYQ